MLNSIKSTILALRYPFISMRDGFMYNRCVWIPWLDSILYRLYDKAYCKFSILYEYVNKDSIQSKRLYLDAVDLTIAINDKRQIHIDYYGNCACEPQEITFNFPFGEEFEIVDITMFGNQIKILFTSQDDRINNGQSYYYREFQFVRNEKYVSKIAFLTKVQTFISKFWIFYPTTKLDGMPEGWRKAFGVKMCEEIKKQLKKENQLNDYHVYDIKEKYGALRWYDNGCSQEINNIINKYYELSKHTCVVCGDKATRVSLGYILPYCDKCDKDLITEDINDYYNTEILKHEIN